MREKKPSYVCFCKDGALDHHERGPIVFSNEYLTAFACKRCGLVYWEHPAPSHPTRDLQCKGTTKYGKRCKLNAVYGGYCGNHQGQKNLSKLVT